MIRIPNAQYRRLWHSLGRWPTVCWEWHIFFERRGRGAKTRGDCGFPSSATRSIQVSPNLPPQFPGREDGAKRPTTYKWQHLIKSERPTPRNSLHHLAYTGIQTKQILQFRVGTAVHSFMIWVNPSVSLPKHTLGTLSGRCGSLKPHHSPNCFEVLDPHFTSRKLR